MLRTSFELGDRNKQDTTLELNRHTTVGLGASKPIASSFDLGGSQTMRTSFELGASKLSSRTSFEGSIIERVQREDLIKRRNPLGILFDDICYRIENDTEMQNRLQDEIRLRKSSSIDLVYDHLLNGLINRFNFNLIEDFEANDLTWQYDLNPDKYVHRVLHGPFKDWTLSIQLVTAFFFFPRMFKITLNSNDLRSRSCQIC